MKRYYFKQMSTGFCLEPCRVNIGEFENKIGSMSCNECEHNKGHGTNWRGKYWIKCKVLDQALGK